MPASKFLRTVTVETDVDIYADDIDDELLLELAQERGLIGGEDKNDITEMFYAFKLGKTDRAIELARQIAQDHTGRIL